jgi:hypothetical protein
MKLGGLFAYFPEPAVIAGVPQWTDDYSDLFSVLKRGHAEPWISP